MKDIKEKILKNKNIKLYGIYTILFLISIIVIFYPFYKLNKSFIWQTDGFGQHFAILYNFNEIIRSALTYLGEGISTFSWDIGIGGDVIGEFSYYIIGDPFSYLSLLFPMDKLEFAYNFLIILRIYFVGIAFLTYCKYHKKKIFNSIIGALIYTFCGYILFAAVRHPYFTNALIMLPIVFLGVDKLLKDNKGLVFTISIAIMAIMNYYFLYMITVLAVIYAVIKYFTEYNDKSLKNLLKKVLKATISYLLGILIAGVILFPTIYAYLNSNRITDIGASYYDLNYYKDTFTGLIANKGSYWTKICVSPIVILMLPISLLKVREYKKNKENLSIFINIIIEVIMLSFAFFGSMMNGFSFQQNRWVFGFVFLLAYMVVLNFDRKLKYTKTEIICIIACLLIYFGIVLKFEVVPINYIQTTFVISASIVILIILSNFKYTKKIQKVVPYLTTIIVLISIYNYANQLYNTNEYANEFKDSNKVMDLYNTYNGTLQNFGQAIDYIKSQDNEFYRISDVKESNNTNMSLVLNYKSLNQYLSIGNKYTGELCKDLIIRNYRDTNALQKLDARTKITTLLGNKYYIVTNKEKNYIPYGYTLYKKIENKENKKNPTLIYKNENSLSLGIFYDSYIIKDDYDKLSELEKEQAILDTAVIDNGQEISNYNINYNEKLVQEVKNKTTKECKFNIKDNDKIVVDKNTIETTQKDQSITLNLSENIENSELYLYLDNVEFSPKNSSFKYTITAKYGNISKKQTVQDKNTNAYYVDMPGILINLGYKNNHKGSIKLTFSSKGTYKFDSIKLISVPMDVYNESIKNRKQTNFKLTNYSNNYIKGNIRNEKSGILQLSTSYTKGWKAYVDGVETEIINVNTAFVGVPLKAGEHEIYFKYETPYLKLGIVITIISSILFIGYVIYKFKNTKEANIIVKK